MSRKRKAKAVAEARNNQRLFSCGSALALFHTSSRGRAQAEGGDAHKERGGVTVSHAAAVLTRLGQHVCAPAPAAGEDAWPLTGGGVRTLGVVD